MRACRGTSLLGWVTAALVAGALAAACSVDPSSIRGPCQTDTDCPDDGVPCTKEVCASDGFCDREPQSLPLGDKGCDDDNPCTEDSCQGGACAHEAWDRSPSDGNECTVDSCQGTQEMHKPVANGTTCGLGGMLTCQAGKCNCTVASECGLNTECLKYECKESACSSIGEPAGALVDGLEVGDCLKRVCDGENSVIIVPDVTDVPSDAITGNCKSKACDDQGNVLDQDDPSDVPLDDENPCTEEGCTGGVPINHEPKPNGTECGAGPVCGLAPGGGYALTPADQCVGGACSGSFPVSCGLFACEPGGAACLAVCANEADCVVGAFCEMATNSCELSAGIGDPCMNQAECAAGTYCVDGVCCNAKCEGLCERCNDAGAKGLCTPVPNGQDPASECPGSEACNGAGECASAQGGGCTMDSECISTVCEDTVCCDVACPGACARCDLPGAGGKCNNVPANMQVTGCAAGQACDGIGNCKTQNGSPCGANAECLSGFCSDGYCCNNACAGACARCDLPGNVGACTNVPAGQQVAGCSGASACDGNNLCKKANGQICSLVSDCASGFCPAETVGSKYCCDAACTGTCQSCAGTKTQAGVNGKCDFIKAKTDPDNECPGACEAVTGKACCDGMGVCNP